MSGFKRNKTFVLVFEDAEYEGLEVRAKGIPVGGLLGILDVVELMTMAGKQIDVSRIKDIDLLFRVFAGCPAGCTDSHLADAALADNTHYAKRLLSWNLLDDDTDEPVPADYAGLRAQDLDFAVSIVMAWLDAVIGTPGELGKASNSGGQLPEESLPMEPLSLAQAS